MPTFLPRIGLSYISVVVLLLPFCLWSCTVTSDLCRIVVDEVSGVALEEVEEVAGLIRA
jgi:hypothetical protein